MDRIIIHWTAGTHKASATDLKHYHFIVEGDGNVVAGDLPPEANKSTSTPYMQHTRALNTGSIGVAIAAMHGAQERPFKAGKHPITQVQIDAMAALCADLCETYDIPVSRQTVLTHAEVQPTLKVWQRGKWDVTWLPGMKTVGDPVEVGNTLRDMVRVELSKIPPQKTKAPAPDPTPTIDTQPPTGGLWAALAGILKAISMKFRQ